MSKSMDHINMTAPHIQFQNTNPPHNISSPSDSMPPNFNPHRSSPQQQQHQTEEQLIRNLAEQLKTFDPQQQHQFSESVDANKASHTSSQQTQMPTPYFVPTKYDDQQDGTSPFGAPPTSFQQTQMPTPHFVSTGYGDQQGKTSSFGASPISFQQTQMPTPYFVLTGYGNQQDKTSLFAAPTSSQQTQMSTLYFVPTGYDDQQGKTYPFGAPPTSFLGMLPLPNPGATRFPTAFPRSTLPNANVSSAFNSTSSPPLPSSAGQTSTFIGQQQQIPLALPPQQSGFYGQQQVLMQQRPGLPAFHSNNNTFRQQQQVPQPSSGSSPATINPSFLQSTAIPTPPPLASQQPYSGYPPQNNFYNPGQQ